MTYNARASRRCIYRQLTRTSRPAFIIIKLRWWDDVWNIWQKAVGIKERGSPGFWCLPSMLPWKWRQREENAAFHAAALDTVAAAILLPTPKSYVNQLFQAFIQEQKGKVREYNWPPVSMGWSSSHRTGGQAWWQLDHFDGIAARLPAEFGAYRFGRCGGCWSGKFKLK